MQMCNVKLSHFLKPITVYCLHRKKKALSKKSSFQGHCGEGSGKQEDDLFRALV